MKVWTHPQDVAPTSDLMGSTRISSGRAMLITTEEHYLHNIFEHGNICPGDLGPPSDAPQVQVVRQPPLLVDTAQLSKHLYLRQYIETHDN